MLALGWSSGLSRLHRGADCGDGQNPLIMLAELLSVSSISMTNVWSSGDSTLLLSIILTHIITKYNAPTQNKGD